MHGKQQWSTCKQHVINGITKHIMHHIDRNNGIIKRKEQHWNE